MEVKTESGGTFNAAGSGTKGIAIAGLVTGAAALVGNGLLNGIGSCGRNWGCQCGNGQCGSNPVTQSELAGMQALGSVISELEKEKAQRYTDSAVIAQGEKSAAEQRELSKNLIDIGVGLTRIDEQNKCLRSEMAYEKQIVELKIKNLEEKLAGAIALESERRAAGDRGLNCYVNATFVPGKLVMPADSICPQTMPRYNSWVAPTETATTPAA